MGPSGKFCPLHRPNTHVGVDIAGRRIRKGAVDSVLKDAGGTTPPAFDSAVERIARTGGTPLAVSENGRLLGVIHLKDMVSPASRKDSPRFAPWASAR